jgi:hypothetical protein
VADDLNRSADLIRRALDANLQYYAAIGKHTVEYVQALAALVDGVRQSNPPGSTPLPRAHAAAPPPLAPARPASTATPAALVLEAADGGTATGLFMVENALTERVSAPIAPSAFRAEDGREVAPKLALEPEAVTLAPGEQMLVRVTAMIDGSYEPDVGYRGELTVPGIAGTRVPLVLRRTAGTQA